MIRIMPAIDYALRLALPGSNDDGSGHPSHASRIRVRLGVVTA